MSLRSLFAARAETQEGCFSCTHFCDDPARIEAALPGLATLSSGQASVRGRDGLCLAHQRLTNGRHRCPAFAEAAPMPSAS